jgi:hypothetical protein
MKKKEFNNLYEKNPESAVASPQLTLGFFALAF